MSEDTALSFCKIVCSTEAEHGSFELVRKFNKTNYLLLAWNLQKVHAVLEFRYIECPFIEAFQQLRLLHHHNPAILVKDSNLGIAH